MNKGNSISPYCTHDITETVCSFRRNGRESTDLAVANKWCLGFVREIAIDTVQEKDSHHSSHNVTGNQPSCEKNYDELYHYYWMRDVATPYCKKIRRSSMCVMFTKKRVDSGKAVLMWKRASIYTHGSKITPNERKTSTNSIIIIW